MEWEDEVPADNVTVKAEIEVRGRILDVLSDVYRAVNSRHSYCDIKLSEDGLTHNLNLHLTNHQSFIPKVIAKLKFDDEVQRNLYANSRDPKLVADEILRRIIKAAGGKRSIMG